MNLSRPSRWVIGIFTFILLILIVLNFFIDEPLRRYMEREVNRNLKGYQARIGALKFQPIGLSIDLKNVLIAQEANPVPPVAQIEKLSASIQWRELLHGHLVSDWEIVHPIVFIHLQQAKKESEDKTPVANRGVKEAVKNVYPIKINHFEIIEGDLTYLDENPLNQIHIQNIHFVAENILNTASEKGVYPADIRFSGKAFNTGKISLVGYADLLAKPYLAVKGKMTLEEIPLKEFQPLLRHINLFVSDGVASAHGDLEYAPWTKAVHFDEIVFQGVSADYIHHPEASAETEEKTKKVAKEASATENQPEFFWEIDKLKLRKSIVGVVNKGTNPDYRLFVEDTDLDLTDLSNHLVQGTTNGKLKGRFMGSGNLAAEITFRPEVHGPDLDLSVKIENTGMKSMNDLWRAYGNFDVVAGLFSFFMEVSIKNNAVTGYVKPLFKDMKVYDKRQDKDKKLFHRLYEKLVGGLARLLENPRREEVATKADISGKIDNPEMSAWQVVARLIRNAFIKAILPGFEGEINQKNR